jgi:hypothetical protein
MRYRTIKISADRSGSFLLNTVLPHHSRLRPISQTLSGTFFFLLYQPLSISENPFDQCYQRSGFALHHRLISFDPLLPHHGRLRPIRRRFPIHSSFFCTSRSQISENQFHQCYQR